MVALWGCQPVLGLPRGRGGGVGAPSGFGGSTRTPVQLLFCRRQETAAAVPGRVATPHHPHPTKRHEGFQKTHKNPWERPVPKELSTVYTTWSSSLPAQHWCLWEDASLLPF